MKNKDKTLFLRLMDDLGSNDPAHKVLDFLVIHDSDYPVDDISRHSKVEYSQTEALLKQWEQIGVVKTREIDETTHYRLNSEHFFVKEFKQYYWNLSKKITDYNFEKRKKCC